MWIRSLAAMLFLFTTTFGSNAYTYFDKRLIPQRLKVKMCEQNPSLDICELKSANKVRALELSPDWQFKQEMCKDLPFLVICRFLPSRNVYNVTIEPMLPIFESTRKTIGSENPTGDSPSLSSVPIVSTTRKQVLGSRTGTITKLPPTIRPGVSNVPKNVVFTTTTNALFEPSSSTLSPTPASTRQPTLSSTHTSTHLSTVLVPLSSTVFSRHKTITRLTPTSAPTSVSSTTSSAAPQTMHSALSSSTPLPILPKHPELNELPSTTAPTSTTFLSSSTTTTDDTSSEAASEEVLDTELSTTTLAAALLPTTIYDITDEKDDDD